MFIGVCTCKECWFLVAPFLIHHLDHHNDDLISGKYFVTFYVNYCLLNGRITPDMDNFTCISDKGRSVVDYMFMPLENIQNVEQFAVLTVTGLCSGLDINSARGKPDHSILCADLSVSYVNHVNILNKKINDPPNRNCQVLNERMYFKYNCKTIPETFMASDDIIMQINITIDSIEQRQTSQKSIDSIYEKVCKFIIKKWTKTLSILIPGIPNELVVVSNLGGTHT